MGCQGSPLSFFFSLILCTTSISLPLSLLSRPPHTHTGTDTQRNLHFPFWSFTFTFCITQGWQLNHNLFIFLKQLIPLSLQWSLLPLISLSIDFLGKCCCQPIRKTLLHVTSLVYWRRFTGLDFYRELGDNPSQCEHLFASLLCCVKDCCSVKV